MSGSSAQLRERVQAVLGSRFEAAFVVGQPPPETLPSVLGDIPRGALTEVAGPPSSGRTSLVYSVLATASAGQELCAFIDASDTFDPESAASAGVRLSHVLWVRCGGNVEHALKAADLLVQVGGFGVIAIDLGETQGKVLRRIPLASWFRLRQAVESTRTILMVVAQQIHTHSCAAFRIELRRSRALWHGLLPGCLLDGVEALAYCIRRHQTRELRFTVSR